VTHYVSQAYHLAYWTTADGQTVTGSLGQNVPFVMSVVSGIGAGVLQGAAEKRTLDADPERFPPKAVAWVKAAVRDANSRWRDERGQTPPVFLPCFPSLPCCACRLFSRRYWELLREEMAEEQAKAKEMAEEACKRALSSKPMLGAGSSFSRARNGGIESPEATRVRRPSRDMGRERTSSNDTDYTDHGLLTGASLPLASTVTCAAIGVTQSVMETVSSAFDHGTQATGEAQHKVAFEC
jgi:hypothetical protein